MKIFNVEVDTHLREIVRQSGENDRDKKMEEKKQCHVIKTSRENERKKEFRPLIERLPRNSKEKEDLTAYLLMKIFLMHE